MSKQISIHYNVFQTIGEQISNEYEVQEIELLEKLKEDIFMLYIHDILTESQKDTAIQRLNKKVVKNIRSKTP